MMALQIENIFELWLLPESSHDALSNYFSEINQHFISRIKRYSLFEINKLNDSDAQDLSSIIINKIHKRINNISRPALELKRFFGYSFMVIRNSIIDFTRRKMLQEQSERKLYNPPKKATIKVKKMNLSSEQILERYKCWKVINDEDSFSNIRMHYMSVGEAGYTVAKTPTDLITKYYLWFNNDLDERYNMWQAIDNMRKSVKEERLKPKPDPMVGAVLVDENGFVIANAWRGKDDENGKGHCEYRLLEHEMKTPENIKYVHKEYEILVPDEASDVKASVTELNLKNATLYVTLEPCSGRNAPKCSCADRIIHSGIKTIYIGLRDPDSDIDGNGIKRLKDAGITVRYFHQDLLFEIISSTNRDNEQQNLEFIQSKKEFYMQEQPELFVNNVLLGL